MSIRWWYAAVLLAGCSGWQPVEECDGGACLDRGGRSNGTLSLDIELPAVTETGPRFARIQVADGATRSFDTEWEGRGDVFARLDDTASWQCVRVGGDPSITRVLVRVSLCVDDRCLDIDEDASAPRAEIAISEPFYVGKTTRVELGGLVFARPTAVIDVDRCAVEGCALGLASNFCVTSGEHFCADGNDVELRTQCTGDPFFLSL